MKPFAIVTLVLAVMLTTLALVASSTDTTTLAGEYEWTRGGSSGELTAYFMPTGEGTWDVSFRFVFQDSRHVYSGTAKGSLTDGALAGAVENDDKRRTFTFAGTFEDGVFSGTHSETTNGRERETGTLSLAG